jgi:hypothetical protein
MSGTARSSKPPKEDDDEDKKNDDGNDGRYPHLYLLYNEIGFK